MENDTNATIVIEIEKSKKKCLNIVAKYRQWTCTSLSCPYKTRDVEDQIKRFQDMLKVWQEVLTKGNQTVICGDINIDRHAPNSPELRPELKDMIEMIEKFKRDNNLTQMNHKPTRHRCNQRSTLLDLFYVNSPEKCTDIRNGANSTSEHDYVVMTVQNQSIIRKKQFYMTRDTRNLVYANLEHMINNSEDLQSLFSEDDPDEIAEKYINGWNAIIEELAPLKRVQIKRDHEDMVSEASDTLKKMHDNALNKAITNKDTNEFRYAKNLQNILKRQLDKDKKAYMEKNLRNKKRRWKILNHTEQKEEETPTRIVFRGEDTSSQKRIGEIFGEYFKDKVETIRKDFDTSTDDAMEVFEKLIPNPL